MDDLEPIAQEIAALGSRMTAVEGRVAATELAAAGLEHAAEATARALAEIATHWDQVYEALRRKDPAQIS